jgi:hypothetical protein
MRALATAAVLLALLGAAPTRAACPPPELLLQSVRTATRIQIEQLGAEGLRVDTPLAHVPGRTLGYEVIGVFRVSGLAAEALQRAFGRRDSYACTPTAPRATFETPGALAVGLLFASRGGAVAVALHLPEGVVEVQLAGGVHTRAPLSQTGQRRWEEALQLLARETGTSAQEFYEQMLPPVQVAPEPDAAPAAPDSVNAPRPAPRDASRRSR